MFFSEDEINSNLNCDQCSERLDEPRLTPCGASICKLCAEQIKIVNNEFKCTLCAQVHPFLSSSELPVNKKLLSLLNLKANEVHRSDSVRTLKLRLNDLQVRIDQLKFGLNNGADKIKEHCINLRSEVQLATELIVKQIYDFNDEFIEKINLYEKECVEGLEANKEDKDEYLKLINELDLFRTTWTNYLKQFEISDKTVQETNDLANKLLIKAENERSKLDTVIFSGNILKFERNHSRLSSSIMGSFTSKFNIMSCILTHKQSKSLMKFCNFSDSQKWKLIYQGSVDGFSANSFHSKCDQKRNTLVIIKANNSSIFGGYTQEAWSSDNLYKNDANAFVFNYTRENKLAMIKCSNSPNAIYCNASCGPIFGGGHDLFIGNNANVNSSSYSNLGHSYRHPQLLFGSNEAKTFFAGAYNFQVNEIEVFMKE